MEQKKALFAGKAVDGAGEVCYTTICVDACVAQLAEQLTRNEQVAGSNPATSSKKATPDRVLLFLLSLSGVEVYPPSRGKSSHKLQLLAGIARHLSSLRWRYMYQRCFSEGLLRCRLHSAPPHIHLKRQLDTLHMKCRLAGIIADICAIIETEYRQNGTFHLASTTFCRMRSLGVERKCWFSTNCPCICCLFVVFLIASKRFVVCIWGIACR